MLVVHRPGAGEGTVAASLPLGYLLYKWWAHWLGSRWGHQSKRRPEERNPPIIGEGLGYRRGVVIGVNVVVEAEGSQRRALHHVPHGFGTP